MLGIKTAVSFNLTITVTSSPAAEQEGDRIRKRQGRHLARAEATKRPCLTIERSLLSARHVAAVQHDRVLNGIPIRVDITELRTTKAPKYFWFS